MIEPWMRSEYWDKEENEELDNYLSRRRSLVSSYLDIVKKRGIPILINLNGVLNIIYSKEHEFKFPEECDICRHTQPPSARYGRIIKVIDPDYLDGLISDNNKNPGVWRKCFCVKKLIESRQRGTKRKLRTLRVDDFIQSQESSLDIDKEEAVPF